MSLRQDLRASLYSFLSEGQYHGIRFVKFARREGVAHSS